MLFKDQAQHIVARWECLREEDDIEVLAAQTAVALSRVADVPEEIFDALDGLLGFGLRKRGTRIHRVLCYLRELATENFRPQAATQPSLEGEAGSDLPAGDRPPSRRAVARLVYPCLVTRCPRCARENEDDNAFCGRCGYEFAQFTPTVVAEGDQHFCYRHKKEATELSCGRCGRFLCHRCAVIGPAGVRCRDCSRNKVPVRARAVVGDARMGLSRLLRAGPFAIYWWFLIASMAFGLVRGCMYLREPAPSRRPPVSAESANPEDR